MIPLPVKGALHLHRNPYAVTEIYSGCELFTTEQVEIPPKSAALVKTGTSFQIPFAHMGLVTIERSLAAEGLLFLPGVDVVLSGDFEPIDLAVYNFTDQPVVVPAGRSVAHFALLNVEQFYVV